MIPTRLVLTLAVASVLALNGCADRAAEGAGDGATSSPSETSAAPSPSSTSSSATPAATPAALVVAIPEDFPLSAGMGGESPDPTIPVTEQGTGLQELTVCDEQPLAALEPLDRRVADNSGGEAADTRDLVLLASAEDAARTAEEIASGSRACPVREAGDTVTTTEVLSSPFGDPGFVLVSTFRIGGQPSPSVVVNHVMPDGNALLVTGTYGEWPGPAQAVQETAARLTETVAALSAFARATEPSATAVAAAALPARLDLMAGLPEDGGDYEVVPQGADAEGIAPVEMCRRQVWPVAGAEGAVRLATNASGPEHFEGHELLLLTDEAAALDAMAPFHEAARGCDTSGNQVWTHLEPRDGADRITVGLTYTDGLGSSVFQLTRMDHALLLVTTYGEGTIDSLPTQAAEVTRTSRGIGRQLCELDVLDC